MKELVENMKELQKYAKTLDKEWPEDLFQDTALRILERPELVPSQDFLPWAKRVMKNLYLNRLRWERIHGTTELPEDGGPEIEEELDPYLYKLVTDTLPKTHVEVFWMYVSGWTGKEISEILEIPEGTVKSRIHYSKNKLRSELSKEQECLYRCKE